MVVVVLRFELFVVVVDSNALEMNCFEHLVGVMHGCCSCWKRASDTYSLRRGVR